MDKIIGPSQKGTFKQSVIKLRMCILHWVNATETTVCPPKSLSWKGQKRPSVGKDVAQLQHSIAGGVGQGKWIGISTLGSYMAEPTTVRPTLPLWAVTAPGATSAEMHPHSHQERLQEYTNDWMKTPKCPSGELKNKLWYIHTILGSNKKDYLLIAPKNGIKRIQMHTCVCNIYYI